MRCLKICKRKYSGDLHLHHGEVQWLFAVGNYSKGYDPGRVSGGKDCGH